MKLRPLNDWVVVRCAPIRQLTVSGLLLVHGERVRFAEVIAVGPGRFFKDKKHPVPPDVSPGDRVVFFRETLETQQGKNIVRLMQELDEEDLGVIRATDILFVIPPGMEVDVR